jgi:hypothetical protein
MALREESTGPARRDPSRLERLSRAAPAARDHRILTDAATAPAGKSAGSSWPRSRPSRAAADYCDIQITLGQITRAADPGRRHFDRLCPRHRRKADGVGTRVKEEEAMRTGGLRDCGAVLLFMISSVYCR